MPDEYFNIYSPMFVNDVTVTVPGAAPSSVNGKQCLTESSAHELRLLLAKKGHDSVVVHGHPMNKMGGAAASQAVPWLQFIDNQTGKSGPTFINAGLIANYWKHADGRIANTPNVALKYAIQEVMMEKEAQKWEDNISGIIDPDLSGKP